MNSRSSISEPSIRALIPENARSVLLLLENVFRLSQTTFTSHEDFSFTEEQERAYLQRFSPPPNLALGAFEDEHLLGIICLEQFPLLRMRHRGTISISVHPDHQSRGIGTQLLATLLAQANPALRNLEASILSNNPASEKLFRAAGFQLEAVHHEAACINGIFYDEKFFILRRHSEIHT